jgi:hypothetical protein
MADAGGSQAHRRPPNASQNATRIQTPYNEEPTQTPHSTEPTDWHILIDTLSTIKRDLEKVGGIEIGSHTVRSIGDAITQVRALWTQAVRQPEDTDTRLARMEKTLEKLARGTPTMNGKLNTWAKIAAQGPAAARRPIAGGVPLRASVRIRMTGAKEMGHEEVLKEAKKYIPGAYAMKQLRSGDIDIMVPDQAAKDAALNRLEAESIEGMKILRQDYLIEIPGVPLSLKVCHGKDADNSGLIQNICAATKKIVSNITINTVRWLHAPDSQKKRLGPIKTRGTLILSLPSQALQLKAVQAGIIIDSQHFEVRLFSHSLQVKQCFNCGQWGHTQAACGRDPRCGHCASPHRTTDCPMDRVSCVNCGRKHKAWQRAACGTFQAYIEKIQGQRADAYALSNRIRLAADSQSTLLGDDFQIVQNKRRTRQQSPAPPGAPRKAAGRPTFVEQAARDPTQGRLTHTRSMVIARNSQASRARSEENTASRQISLEISEDNILIPSTESNVF